MNRSFTRWRWLRLLAAAVSLVFVTSGAVSLLSAGQARADISPGTGSSGASILSVEPHDGSLSVGVTLGEAFAGHTNNFARAQSLGIDLGAVGTDLTGYNCGKQLLKPNQIPEPLQTETGETGASKGITESPTRSEKGTAGSFGATESVLANAVPYALAQTAFAPLVEDGFTLSGLSSSAWSGVVHGVREAGATADIGELSLAGNVVQIKGMHWEAIYPSGGTAKPTGTFSIGQVLIHGVGIKGLNLGSVQNLLNQVLGVLGIKIILPVSEIVQGVQFVTPFEIQIVPNTLRDNIINAFLNATLPEQQFLFGGLEDGFNSSEPAQLEQLLCNSDVPITLAEVYLASANGSGYFTGGLGGVDASSGSVKTNPYSLSLPSLHVGGGQVIDIAGTPGVAAIPGTSGTPGGVLAGSGATAPQTAAPPTTAPPAARITPAAAVKYGAGGPLLAIGLVGLGLLALLAEGDRRSMRRAMKSATFEE